jgi:hypothetical protein
MINTVWIYVDTSKEVGDKDHLKVFTSEEAANAWFAERDPEVVAFENEPLTRGSLGTHTSKARPIIARAWGLKVYDGVW